MVKLNFLWLTLAFELIPLLAPAQEDVTHSVATTKVRADPAHPFVLEKTIPRCRGVFMRRASAR